MTTGPQYRPIAVLVAVVLGSGGTSVIVPKLLPDWYRPDPSTGADLRAVRREVDELRADFRAFLMVGPRKVTENQARILQKLDTLLLEIRARGTEHRQAE